jgi:hypothetical protein
MRVELYEASFSLHASIGDERSALLALFEQLLLESSLNAGNS